MANSLLTGISGLRGHQKMLEVVGNNLANLNTTSFKSSRVLFSDLMYEVQRGASSSSTGLAWQRECRADRNRQSGVSGRYELPAGKS